MKRLLLAGKPAAVLLVIFLFVRCGEELEGDFYISDEARKYQTDTTLTSLRFIDNYGISEEFRMDQHLWYTTHHYFSEWGIDGKARGETFGVAYTSTLNRFFFMYVLRASVGYTNLEIEWNQKDLLVYNMLTNKVENGVEAEVSFIDSLFVRGIKYDDVIVVDYSKKIAEIDSNTPVKTYISGQKGLIRIERKDDVVLERVK